MKTIVTAVAVASLPVQAFAKASSWDADVMNVCSSPGMCRIK